MEGADGAARRLSSHTARPLRPWKAALAWRARVEPSEEAAAIGEACPDDAPFHLIGHSYGGGVRLRYALSFPERLRSLTLIEPSCFHILRRPRGNHAHLLDEVRAIAETVHRGVICGDYHGCMATFIDYWGGPGRWGGACPRRRSRSSRELAVLVAHHFWSLIEENSPLAAYADIDVPTLIVCGTRSPQPSRVIARLLADTCRARGTARSAMPATCRRSRTRPTSTRSYWSICGRAPPGRILRKPRSKSWIRRRCATYSGALSSSASMSSSERPKWWPISWIRTWRTTCARSSPVSHQ